jgi:hypothetical protein
MEADPWRAEEYGELINLSETSMETADAKRETNKSNTILIQTVGRALNIKSGAGGRALSRTSSFVIS